MSAIEQRDLSDLDEFTDGFPHDLFEELRAQAAVSWHPATEHTPDGVGFWSVVRHAESLAVLKDEVTFSSQGGGDRPVGGTLLPDSNAAGRMMNMMDDPRHCRIRRLVSKGFTPRMLGGLEGELRVRLRRLLDDALERRQADFVADVAHELPLQAICLMLGVPEEDRHMLAEWVDHTFDFPDRPAFEHNDVSRAATRSLLAYGRDLIAEKRRHPQDDVLSVVVHAELVDEEPSSLTEQELESFFYLLFGAGSDTTRSASAGGVLALAEDPSEYDRLRANPSALNLALDEIVRFTSPAAYNRRTATRDVELGGCEIRAGDKVVFWEASANRDELVFDDPHRLRVDRDPNPHLGFGFGHHHCLGAGLARLELRVIFSELIASVEEISIAGEPEWTRSNKHTGLRHLPVEMRSAR